MEENLNGGNAADPSSPTGNEGSNRVDSEGVIHNPEGVLKKNSELLGVNKKLKGEIESMREKLDSMEREKLSKEGKKDEIIQKLEDDLRGTKDMYKNAVGKFLEKSVRSSFDKVATKLGAKRPDHLYKLLQDDVYGSLGESIDKETFSIDEDRLTTFLEEKKKGDFVDFFRVKDVKVHDVSPGSAPPKEKKITMDMDDDKAWELIAKQKGWA